MVDSLTTHAVLWVCLRSARYFRSRDRLDWCVTYLSSLGDLDVFDAALHEVLVGLLAE